jgi:alanyl-tRNA synthetase
LAKSNLPEKNLQEAEYLTNDIIMQNLPINISYENYENLSKSGVRRIPERRGKFRLVGIGDFELTACGGTHCAFTGEIGSLKIIGVEKIRRHTRISFLCGFEAIKDYYKKNEVIGKLTSRFTCHFSDLENSIGKLNEYSENLKGEVGRLQKELLPFQLQILKNDAVEISGIKIISKVFNSYDFKNLKDMALNITKEIRAIVLFGLVDKLIISVSDGLGYNASLMTKLFIKHFGGRGGGNPVIAQIGGIPGNDLDSKLIEYVQILKNDMIRE